MPCNKLRPFPPLLWPLLLLTLCLTACPGRDVRAPSGQRAVEGALPAEPRPARIALADVERVFDYGNMRLAESYAGEFISSPGHDPFQLPRAWRFLALAAVENGRAAPALEALEQWRQYSLRDNLSEEWLRAWYAAMSLLPQQEAFQLAAGIAAAPRQNESLAREARLFLLERRILPANGREALSRFAELYAQEQPPRKKVLEERLFRFLHTVEPSVLSSLMRLTTDENENRYPYALVRLENARRLFWEQKTRDTARDNMVYTREGSQLMDMSLFRAWNQPDFSILRKVPVNNRDIALILPLSGQYGNLSEKIARGADLARRGLEAHGKHIRVHVIDSDQSGWMNEFAGLPLETRVVGGPLRLEDYEVIKGLNLDKRHFFFAFLPRLDEGAEGLTAWRFFPSREDQTRVMLDYALDLDLRDYAVLAPDQGDYSRNMFELFHAQAAEKGLNVTRSAYYPATQYHQWVKTVSDFLGIIPEAEELPILDFQALFLPDNWANSSRIISHVFYLMENQLLFLGTNLWELGLSSQQRLALRNFRLAIFPGAWDQHSLSPSGMILRSAAALDGRETADFWLSLGYDFTLMAAGLYLPRNADAEDMNRALTNLPALPWGGAPIYWDSYGLAGQDLLVFTPTENGFALADKERLRTRLLTPTMQTGQKPPAFPQIGQVGATPEPADAD